MKKNHTLLRLVATALLVDRSLPGGKNNERAKRPDALTNIRPLFLISILRRD
jgi:hypothetical protein